MSTFRAFEIPKESELVEFFGAEPTERSVKDGFWAFVVTDERGVKLRFSIDLFERSAQTMLSVREVVVEIVSHELAERLFIKGTQLHATFIGNDTKTLLVVEVAPLIKVTWSTLQTAG
jgi:hypothetical protein